MQRVKTKIKVKAEPRTETGTIRSNKLRKEGLIPAVLYGGGIDTLLLKVAQKDIQKVIDEETVIVDLEVDNKIQLAQVKKIQWDHIFSTVYHVDFQAIREDEGIETEVPLVIKGEPKGILEGGVLDINIRSITLECKPDQIPERILIDVSNLALNERIRVSDIKLPEGAKLISNPNVVVASCKTPVEEPEPTAVAAEEGAAQPEVIKKGKEAAEEKSEEPAEPKNK